MSLLYEPEMSFVNNFTSPDFQAKEFTLEIPLNFNSFSDKNTKKMSEKGDIHTASKNFTLPPAVTAVTAVTNLTSVCDLVTQLTITDKLRNLNHDIQE